MYGLKKLDILIILVLCIGILSSFALMRSSHGSAVLLVETEEGKTYYTLDDNDFEVRTKDGFLHVSIRDGKARITESSCPDKWCMRIGSVSSPGHSIICLPSHIILSIEEGKVGRHTESDTITR